MNPVCLIPKNAMQQIQRFKRFFLALWLPKGKFVDRQNNLQRYGAH